MDEPRRYYGTDSTEDFDTLAEATEQPDGSLHIEVVTVEKDERRLMALYGPCEACGAPRQEVHEVDEDGAMWRLVCTRDHDHPA